MGEGTDLVISGMQGVNILAAPEWFTAINPAKRIPVLRDRSIDAAVSIAVATQFVNRRLAGGSVDAACWPKLAAYALRIHARPSFAACIEDESRLFPQGCCPL